jgi:phosphoglycolate phosphatase
VAAIIFDFDGTIADSYDYFLTFLAREAGKKPLTDDQKAEFHGLSLVRMTRRMGVSWLRLPRLLHTCRREMNPAMRHLKPFPGMPEVIRKLHGEGHTLFILSTNTVSNMRKFLQHHELDGYFSELYGGAGLLGKAPALRRLLREQHIETRKAVYVGDEVRDAEAAQSIGVRIITVTWGFARADELKDRKPTGVAHSPQDIIDILSGL